MKYIRITIIAMSMSCIPALPPQIVKSIENTAVDLGKTKCINELDSFDAVFASGFCGIAVEFAKYIINSKLVGMNKTAARRGGYRKAYNEEK